MLACLDLLKFLPISHAVIDFWAVTPQGKVATVGGGELGHHHEAGD